MNITLLNTRAAFSLAQKNGKYSLPALCVEPDGRMVISRAFFLPDLQCRYEKCMREGENVL